MNNQFLQALKELGQFLGRKLDGLAAQFQAENTALREAVRDSQKLIQLDMTTSTIEKIQKTSDLNINKIAKTLEKSDRSIEKIAAALDKVSYEESNRLQKLTTAITALKEAVAKDTTDTTLLHDIADQIRLLVQLEQDTKEDKDDAGSAAITEEIRQSVKALLAAIKESKPKEAKPVDMTPVTAILDKVLVELGRVNNSVIKADASTSLAELIEVIKKQKLEMPKSFKLDDTQLRILANARGGGAGMVPPDILDLTNSKPQTVAIVDGTGNQITSFGGGTQYTEGDVDATITGTAMMWEDTGNTLTPVSAAKPLPTNDPAAKAVLDNVLLAVDGIEALLTTIQGDTTDIEAAIELIDDTIFTDDAGFTLGTSKGIVMAGVAVETDGTDPTTVSAEGDAAAFRTDRQRLLLVNQTHPRFWHTSADYAAAQTNASVRVAPGASLSLYITDLVISNGATAGNITLLDGSGGTVLFELYPAVNGGVSMSFRNPIKLTANTALCLTSTTVTTHSIFVAGYIAP